MPTPEETRRVERVAVKIPIAIKIEPSMEKDFTLAQREVSASTVDMSATGMSVLSSVYIPEGIALVIEFEAQSICPEKEKEGSKIRLKGEVVSSRMMKGQYRLGILIKEISDEDKSAIVKFISTTV